VKKKAMAKTPAARLSSERFGGLRGAAATEKLAIWFAIVSPNVPEELRRERLGRKFLVWLMGKKRGY